MERAVRHSRLAGTTIGPLPNRLGPAVLGAEPLPAHFVILPEQKEVKQEDVVGRGLLLWLLGIPLPIVILIWVLGGLHG
jgi:hypothetical protein